MKIPPGAVVRVVGLVRAADLNGLTGNVVCLLPDKQRHGVDLGSPHGVKRIRPTNLAVVSLASTDYEDRDTGGNVGNVLAPPFSSKKGTTSG